MQRSTKSNVLIRGYEENDCEDLSCLLEEASFLEMVMPWSKEWNLENGREYLWTTAAPPAAPLGILNIYRFSTYQIRQLVRGSTSHFAE